MKKITPRMADKLIKSGKPVKIYWPKYDESATVVIVKRGRFDLFTEDGRLYDRTDCLIDEKEI